MSGNITYIPLRDGRYAAVKTDNVLIDTHSVVIQLQNGEKISVKPQVSEIGDKLVVIRIPKEGNIAIKYLKIVQDPPKRCIIRTIWWKNLKKVYLLVANQILKSSEHI